MTQTIDFIKRFRELAGPYNLNSYKQSADDDWECMLFIGGRKLGLVECSYDAENVLPASMAEADAKALDKWADQAGPLGFESAEEFVLYLVQQMLYFRSMLEQVKAGRLVAVRVNNLAHVDEHGLPTFFSSTRGKTNAKGYAKINPNMQVMNDLLLSYC